MQRTKWIRASVYLAVFVAAVPAMPQAEGPMEVRRGERISLSGKVVVFDGSVPPPGAQIETVCNGRRQAQGNAKSDGGFQVQLGNDPTASMSNARDSGPAGVGSDRFGRAGGGAMDSLGHVDLTGCELRAVLPGYSSSVINLGRRSAFESPEVGNLILTPYGKSGDPTKSPTSDKAPKDAQKALERAIKEARKEDPNWGKVAKELKKAVEVYPEFAEAWYELGEALLHQDEVDKAKEAFERSIQADSNFQKPYPPLSLIELKQGNKEKSAELADKAIGLNPGLTEAHFYSAMSHFMLGQMEKAGESALMVDKLGGMQTFPRALVILGDYYSAKEDFDAAAKSYMRYVEMDQSSPVAAEIRKRMAEWKAEGVIK